MPRVPFVARRLILRARRAVAHTSGGAQGRLRACPRGRPRRGRSRPGIGATVRIRDRDLPGLASRHLEKTSWPGGSRSEAGHGVRSPRPSSARASADLSIFVFGHPNRSGQPLPPSPRHALTHFELPLFAPLTLIGHVARQDAPRRAVRVSRRSAVHGQSLRPAGGA
jgi:hypothetical protein